MDKELKQLFIETHDVDSDPFTRFFNDKDAIRIQDSSAELKKNRKKPNLNSKVIEECYDSEYRLLVAYIKSHSQHDSFWLARDELKLDMLRRSIAKNDILIMSNYLPIIHITEDYSFGINIPTGRQMVARLLVL